MLKKIFIALFLLMLTLNAYCLDLDRAKIYLLKGDYKAAIAEGEKILAKSGRAKDGDELYYVLGMSYLKDGNFLRASDIFEIILREFKDSNFKEEAKLGLADTYLLRQDFSKAQQYYEELIKNNPHTRLKAQIYFRLSQIGFKTGDTRLGEEYLDKLKRDFPLNPESRGDADLSALTQNKNDIYYTVQVGSFSNIMNAKNLVQILIKKGYAAYIEEIKSSGQLSYRVRVGKLQTRQEALDLERKLAEEGYPTKIFP